jgi:hypothetical protein
MPATESVPILRVFCAYRDCRTVISRDKFLCATHWLLLSPEQKRRAYAAWELFTAGTIDAVGLRLRQEGVLREVQQ